MSINHCGALLASAFILTGWLQASELSPAIGFYTIKDKQAAMPQIAAVDNRLVVSVSQKAYLTFELGAASSKEIKKATLRLYLVQDPANCQTPKAVIVRMLEKPSGDEILSNSLQPGYPFKSEFGNAEAAVEVDGSRDGQYWDWDVTELLHAQPSKQNKVTFAIMRVGKDAEGAPLRFTGKEPRKDSGAASKGSAPKLVFE